jgi:hypothetical protein
LNTISQLSAIQNAFNLNRRLGEATAISFLQDQAETFNETFTVSFTKLDGTIATISNQ